MFEKKDFDLITQWRHLNRTTGAWNYIKSLSLFWILLIFCLGPWTAFWYLLWYYGAIVTQDGYNIAFTEYGLILYLFFSEYVRRSWVSYTTGPDMYYRFLNKSTMLGMYIYTSVDAMNKNPESDDACKWIIENIKSEIDLIMYYITIVLMPHRETKAKKPKSNNSASNMIGVKKNSVPPYRICIYNLNTWVYQLEATGCIKNGAIDAINTTMERIANTLEDIESSSKVSDLDAIYIHTVAVIVIYFSLILPYKLVATSGAMIFVFYPFIIFALAGVIFIRKYVGSPFREVSRLGRNSMEDWLEEFTEKNHAYYKVMEERLKMGQKKIFTVRATAHSGKRNMEYQMSSASYTGSWFNDEAALHVLTQDHTI